MRGTGYGTSGIAGEVIFYMAAIVAALWAAYTVLRVVVDLVRAIRSRNGEGVN